MEARMKAKKTPPKASTEGFESLTEKIRPLPDNVVPSEVFQAKMKARLLKLEARPEPSASDKAA